jgi:hypothetical protein
MTLLQWAIVLFLGYPPFAFLLLRFFAVRRPVSPVFRKRRRRPQQWPGKDHVDGIW